MDHRRRAVLLAVAGVALLVGTLAVGALTAPTLGQDASGERRTLLGSQGGTWTEGGSVLMLSGNDVEWQLQNAGAYFEATQLSNGTVAAAFVDGGYQECGPYEPHPEHGCDRTGYRVIDPDAAGGPAVLAEHSFPVRSETNSEVHAIDQLPSGEMALVDMEHEQVRILDGEEVVWQWNASRLYNPPADPTRRDWLHMNDVDAINDTHLLVSVRNANQLLVLERGEGVVEVINEDDDAGNDAVCQQNGRQLVADAEGDVRCGDPDVINHQHNPQWLDGGAVLVADSDNDRVVELHRTADGDWEPAWSLTSAEGVGFHWPRDADRLANGNTLITDTHNSRVVEVTPNGTTVWSAEVTNLPYEADRLPEGEQAGARRYTANGTVADPEDGGIPGLSLLLTSIKGAFPFVPFWFRELHLALSLVGLGLVVGGGVDALLARVGGLRGVRERLTDRGASETDD